MKNILYTPSEIIERNPVLKKKNWTAQKVGQLFAMQLVSGTRGRVALIDENDVLRIFYFAFPSLMQGTRVS